MNIADFDGGTIRRVSFTPANNPPTAVASGNPTTGPAPLTVQFTDTSTPGSAAITEWLWDFGDDGTSIEKNPTHEYTTSGTFLVSLRVTTQAGSDTVHNLARSSPTAKKPRPTVVAARRNNQVAICRRTYSA